MRTAITVDPEIPVPPKLYGGIERIVDILVRSLMGRKHQARWVVRRKQTRLQRFTRSNYQAST